MYSGLKLNTHQSQYCFIRAAIAAKEQTQSLPSLFVCLVTQLCVRACVRARERERDHSFMSCASLGLGNSKVAILPV